MIREDIKRKFNADPHIKKCEPLAAHVSGMQLPMTDEQENQVANASTVDEIFIVLPKYWSFLDFDNLENIAENFCSPESEARQQLEIYKCDVQQFCECRVSEFPPGSLNNGADNLNEGWDKLVVKLEMENPLLKRVLHIKEDIATILNKKASKLVLCDITPGCVAVTFWTTTSLDEELFLTQKQREKLLDAAVVSIEFKGIIVFKGHKTGMIMGILNRLVLRFACV